MDVMILAGGLSHERDVSVRSGRRVKDALESVGARVTLHDVDTDLIPALRSLPEGGVVWPLLHGASGEDGSLQALLELLGVPFVGTASHEARVAWVKPVAKAVLERAGVKTPAFVTFPQSLFREVGADQVLTAIAERFALPVAVKPARGGSALGVSIVSDREELPRAMVHCFAYGDIALIEQAVDGIEVAVSVVDTGSGPVALPAVEVVTDGPYDYEARYVPGRTEYFAPARLTTEQATAVAAAAVRFHEALGLRHLSRTDMILDADGVPYVLDMNTAPGMTETSLFPQAAIAAGHDLASLYRKLVETALRSTGRVGA